MLAGTTVTPAERALIEDLRALKDEAGSHSPSLFTLRDRLPHLDIRVDACFLSNPYATDLFIERLKSDLVDTGELRRVLEFYPSQNQHVASLLEGALGVDHSGIFVCNGAIEAIQAALHRFAGRRIGVIIPTFSPYYEFLRSDQEAYFYKLDRDAGFALDVDDFIGWVARNKIDSVCLINPNNPNGGYIPTGEMRRLLDAFAALDLVILDESFIDFAYEDEQKSRRTLTEDIADMPNVVLVKSMSKDFGVAGLRAGYAVMSPARVRSLVANGHLWNISGLCEFFFRLFVEPTFQHEYAKARLRYLDEAEAFFAELGDVGGVRAYDTMANFCLVELDPAIPVEIAAPLLLIRHGVYIRDCRDKVGLEGGQFVRVAGRKRWENELMIAALQDIVQTCAG